MSKTPAMELHEHSIKCTSSPPVYTLIVQNQGTHNNEFEYSVEVMGITATGRGRSKKEAKQETARNALNLLTNNSTSSPVKSMDYVEEADLKQVINYVGELGDYCLCNKFPVPIYEIKLSVGPPHAMMFTYECQIGNTLVTQSTANTKKQAKQNAAKLMLDKMQEIYPELFAENESNLLQLNENDEQVMENYIRLSILKNSDFGMKIKDFPYYMKSLIAEKQVEGFEEYLQTPYSEENLKSLLALFDFKYAVYDLSEGEELTITAINVEDCPVPICALGMGENAYSDAFNELFTRLQVLLT